MADNELDRYFTMTCRVCGSQRILLHLNIDKACFLVMCQQCQARVCIGFEEFEQPEALTHG